jgi:hypothetical protein
LGRLGLKRKEEYCMGKVEEEEKEEEESIV